MGLAPSAAAASISDLTPHEARLFTLTNQARAENGLAAYAVAGGAVDVARNWSRTMATTGTIAHNPNYVSQLQASGSSNATATSGLATAERGSALWVFVRGKNGDLLLCVVDNGTTQWSSLGGLLS